MSYEIALECARAMGKIRCFELGRRAKIDWRVAAIYLDRMERDGVVSRMNARGWRDTLGIQIAGPDRSACGSDSQLYPGQSESDLGQGHRRLEAVRHLIARELHPDLSEEGAVRAVKVELFKRIWPQIEELLPRHRSKLRAGV
jgi:hypothetical protein